MFLLMNELNLELNRQQLLQSGHEDDLYVSDFICSLSFCGIVLLIDVKIHNKQLIKRKMLQKLNNI